LRAFSGAAAARRALPGDVLRSCAAWLRAQPRLGAPAFEPGLLGFGLARLALGGALRLLLAMLASAWTAGFIVLVPAARWLPFPQALPAALRARRDGLLLNRIRLAPDAARRSCAAVMQPMASMRVLQSALSALKRSLRGGIADLLGARLGRTAHCPP
jgi:hypothetical protein